jgi:glycosyltransferase involved in cell wall biosynthesis
MGYPKEKCVVVNNGVDTSIYKPLMLANENLKTILNIKDNKLILGMVARWDAQKDLNTFLNALKILKNETKHQWHAILVGNGLDQNNEQLVKDVDLRGLKNHISLLGFKNNLVSIYNSFDVCVLTSAYGEGFPNVIAEAMSCGIPCIGTDVGDTKNIINNTGWIFNSKNSEELKNQIKETFEEIKQDKHWLLRKKLARERIVSNFTFSSMLKNYQLEWKNIL